MMFLKSQVSMCGRIERCWLFTYSVPEAQVRHLLPDPLTLQTRGGSAFFNIVVSELSQMRPKGLPHWLGLRYRHVAYRLVVQHKVHEGLYFLRSDADSACVAAAGNLMTDFRFHAAQISMEDSPGATAIEVRAPGANADAVVLRETQTILPTGSPFKNFTEAHAFLKYKPAALTVDRGQVKVLTITRREEDWRSTLRRVQHAQFEFLKPYDAKPLLCFDVEPLNYIWNRAKRA